jgi:hypothetical protein
MTIRSQPRLGIAMALGICVGLVLVVPRVAAASELSSAVDRPLENRDIAAMVAAGIGESVVVAAVEHAPREQLDASPEALGTLGENGVSDSVIAAVRARVGMRGEAHQAQEQGGGDASQQQAPRKPDEIKLYFSEKPTQAFKELGRVSAGKFSTFGRSRKREAIDMELREKAAKLGADAVIAITEDFASVSGVAIEFKRE